MFGLGANELILILLFGFIIFGPDKLPAMAKTIGKAVAKFRTAQAEMSNVIKNEVYDPDSDDPFKNPLDALSQIENKVTKEDQGESFTDRKARYDKQREAKKAAEERRAKRLEQASADQDASEQGGEAPAAVEATEAAEQPTDASKPKLSADELYGTKPKAKKPNKAKKDEHADEKPVEKEPASDEPVEHTLEEAVDAVAEGEGE